MVAVMVSNASGSILVGLFVALVCGVVIARFRINALITALTTMQIVRSLALIRLGRPRRRH